MTRRQRILRNIAIGFVALIVVLFVIAIQVVQTDTFRNYVKQKIIASTEEGTGGTVEIGSFRFDWRHLRASVTDFVIHGNEPKTEAPFIRAKRVQLDIRFFTSIRHLMDVAYLSVENPEANIIVFADGRTNMPMPRQKTASNKTPLENVVDLAVDHFELSNGLLVFASQKQELNVRGNKLRAELWYNVLQQGYTGKLSFEPLYMVSGRNTPVNLTVTLPVALQRDRVDIHDASITSAQTKLLINGSIENMRDPKTSAHISGHVALEDLKNAANLQLVLNARNVPATADLDANATISNSTVQVTGLRLGIGHSDIEASGTLKDPKGQGQLDFKSRLALGELGRLFRVEAQPEGTVVMNGVAKLDQNNNYQLSGNIQGKGLSFRQGAQHISNVDLISAMHFDPHNLDLKGLKLGAFGGEFAGDVSMQDFARYQVRGNLRNLNLRAVARSMGEKQFNYDGSISGPLDAQGDLKSASVVRGLTAHTRLTIAPGRQGVPVSGRLFAEYNGASDTLRVENSYLALPHTRLTLNGSLGKQLNIALTTSDANDLLAATSLKSVVNLNGHQASFTGVVTGSLSAPHLTGHLAANGFSVEQRQFDNLTADLALASNGVTVRNGNLTRGMMQTQFTARVGLRNWQATPNQPLSADATVRNGDLADLMALAGQENKDSSGALTADVHIRGTLGDPTGSATLQAANGAIMGEPFDRMNVQVNLADQLVTIPAASIESNTARVNVTAEYRHPRDNFSTGQLHAHVQSNQVDLAKVHNLQKERPNTAGLLQLNADVAGSLAETKKGETEFQLTSVNGDASARGLRFEGENYGDANATAHTSGKTVSYNLTSNFAGSNIRVNGSTELTREYPTTADADVKNLPVERVLAVAQRKDIPAKGILSGTAHLTGTKDNPQGNADITLTNAVLYDEPIDRLRAQGSYLAKTIEVRQLQAAAGPSRIDASGRYEHPENDLKKGNLEFRVNSSSIDLARIHNVQTRRPGLGGTFQLTAEGRAEVRETEPQLMVKNLDATVAAKQIKAQGKNYGDLNLTAKTAGDKVNFVLASNLAGSSIQGHGDAQLVDHYPVNAQLTFNNVTWTKLQGLIGTENGEAPSFEAVADGQATVHGPVMKADDLKGSVQLSKLQVSSIPRGPGTKPVTVQNQGPISATLGRRVVHIESAHMTGPQTDIQAKGMFSFGDQAMDLTLNANANLALLQDFDRDIDSSGSVVLAATVRGTVSDPRMNGTMDVHNGSFNYTNFPNGISNANGQIVFTGNTASVRNMTAESGGGKLSFGGFATISGNPRFALRGNASSVRVRLQQGVSMVSDANVNLTGTRDGSQLTGTATITRVAYSPQTDIGSFLTRAAPPVQAPTVPSPLLDNMKLDIRVQTSDAMSVQTSLAESLQAQANLRIRGTASNPGVLGRLTITEGTMTFFGEKYTVNSGTIAFYNPVRVEPVLDISLETKAKGVDVVLRATGPVDNMKLSYTSDPPLQFNEIVSLLASGKTPTSDPTLLANQPSQPPQTMQQMGESALVSHAVADPVASRLQRVFGVSQLKIDPTFTSGSTLPQAQLTLQQRVADNLTFTYVTALNNANAQTIQVEMALNPQWSAVATRDQNGIFSVNLLYKRQLR